MRDDRIEHLIRLVEKSDIAELEICEGWGRRIRISKQSAPMPAPMPAPVAAAPAAGPAAAPASAGSETPAADPDSDLVRVVSPMVGTFYRAASPDKPPFVEVGSQVATGQTLCIIEAMKLMNEIASEVTGSIRKILVENAQPVEFGQTLFLIEKSV
jgi:acetyl-CoA carboxylase biotin carboxyl carrier protein